MNKNLQNAFTLVELAIVIVIIGLLVGGVLQGQALIRQSKIQKVITASESYVSALTTFKGKFNCLAGDCGNITNFLDTASATCPAVTANNLCNGNANGRVEYEPNYENFQLWRQLGLANVIKGTYTATHSGGRINPGVNAPLIFDNIAANIMSYSATWNMWWTNTNGAGMNYLVFGSVNYAIDIRNWNPFLETNEAFSIDTKLDDGLPGRGLIRVHTPHAQVASSSLCVNSLDANTATYTLTNDGKVCHIVWMLLL